SLGALLASLSPVNAQAPNTVAANNPNLRTGSLNATWFAVMLPTPKVQAAVGYPLLDVPDFFPAGTHPVLVSSGYTYDVRMSVLRIQDLRQTSIYVPYTDFTKDGKTALNYPLALYIGGENGQLASGVVPSLASILLEGDFLLPGDFQPGMAAYQAIDANTYTSQTQMSLVPNPVSGPGVEPPVLDLTFQTDANPPYNQSTWHEMINQPIVLTSGVVKGMCQRNTYYFNETFADPVFRVGTVTIYNDPAVPNNPPMSVTGTFSNVMGYGAIGENVGYNPEDCHAAA
ncbi:hypothetical protein K490DRAFT_9821, partial [Saccharata proteae CBS 121410]